MDPQYFFNLEQDPNWTTFSFSHNLVQMHKATPKQIEIKSFCTFTKDKSKIIEFLSSKENFAKVFTQYQEIDGPQGQTVQFYIPTPLGVAKRICNATLALHPIEPDKYAAVFQHKPVENLLQNNEIQAEIKNFVFLVEEISIFLTKFWFICSIDPKGTLPEAVVEYMKKKLLLIPRKIKDLIKGKQT